MPTTEQVTSIVDKVRTRLASGECDGVHLKGAGEKLDDDWLSIVIVPGRPGVRALDHATLMSRIERELREQDDDNVLLVPALED
jgi:hypothetical protein